MTEGVPTARGGTPEDYLARIERKVGKLGDDMQALIGNPPADPTGGRIGRLETKMDNFIASTEKKKQLSRAMAISLASLGIVAIGSIGGLIVAIMH